jgi:predicted ATPase
MRIVTLTLKNFRSHKETVLDLDRFNFVRGPNGRRSVIGLLDRLTEFFGPNGTMMRQAQPGWDHLPRS